MQLTTDDATAALTSTCPICGRVADLRGQHVLIQGSAVVVCCSAECLDLSAAGVVAAPFDDDAPSGPARRRGFYPIASSSALLGLLAFTEVSPRPEQAVPVAAALAAALSVLHAREAAAPPPPPDLDAPTQGPRWPPTEAEWVAVISHDAWVHPLNGPVRRMPIRDSRVFGADRPGHRPTGCVNGHCGVDIGEVWGEPVMAAHEGVVDFVQRGPNPDRGGMFVRLSHRGGTVFTQYFHLAAIPRWIRIGRRVLAGEIIGVLGDTGAERSQPHLHFTISVVPGRYLPEQYIDPEPLIALWPLRVPAVDGVASTVSIGEAPGPVRGAARRRRGRRAAADAQPDDATAAPAAAVPAVGDPVGADP